MIELQHLTKRFATQGGTVVALNDINLTIQDGDIYGIIGMSGAGKSTLVRCINMLERPDEGKVVVNGRQMQELSAAELRAARREITMIFQQFNLLMQRTCLRNIMFPMELAKVPKEKAEARARELLELVGINEPDRRLKQYPHELSGGMRQRVMIAIALACEPKLLIADEPTTALDVTIQAQILELMNDLRHKLGMSIIMITHDLGVVAQMCEKIAVMYAGHIVEYGTTDEIFYNPQHEYTKGLINSIPKLNAEEKERLVPIEGQPVDLLNPPAGCPFAPRCKSCMKVCLNKMPPRTELSDTHYTYCWLRQKEEFEKGGKA